MGQDSGLMRHDTTTAVSQELVFLGSREADMSPTDAYHSRPHGWSSALILSSV